MAGRSRGFARGRSGLLGLSVTVLAVASIAISSAAPAQAAFPGENGKIAFSCGVICTINPDGSERTSLTPTIGGSDPAWSPSGDRIAFTVGPGNQAEVYVMNADGTSPAPLTSNQADDEDPAWSPDGSKIVFASSRDDTSQCEPRFECNFNLYVMSADGTGQTRLLNTPARDKDPNWEPNGARIAYGCGSDLCVVGADGSAPTDMGLGGSPNWSPDGSKIAFAGLQSQVFTMSADGTNRTQLTFEEPGFFGPFSFDPAWAPDGSKISLAREPACFTPSGGCGFFIRVGTIDPDGSGFVNLSCCPDSDSQPDWQPHPSPPPSPSDFKNVSKYCKAERERLGYKTQGECVSATVAVSR